MSETKDAFLLDARGIEVTYGAGKGLFGAKSGGVRVLHGVDIAIRRGEAVGIVGESGSGKTTLGRALLRLVPASAGTITFDGQNITTLPAHHMRPLRRRMQMIFQDPMASLNPRQSIGKILSGPVLLHGLAENRHDATIQVKAMLDRVSLPSAVLERSPHELSGGQRQRIGIARAALLKPDFVLADEIVSGLDVSTQAMVLNLLKELSREMGLAMAFISHDLSVIRAICDRVYVLRFGKVVEEGPCATIFDNPHSEYTRHLLDAIPLPEIDSDWLSENPISQAAG
ncbi:MULTISPECIES: ATP-binding cassette domain-containing protein [unclassified Rhizobium]|uniref:ATP-binding cassette domain-containing protein n=1 Tax=unclassified Rhizobium TaxID=2613769 RepID=UPI0017868D70|nr:MULTISPECIES: ATP-binding cassette domain-containing protein [unclassified Rhizobium]MBD8688728.1 ABC transporter ATP-binding protein [Rhizobium sp. CFBP 13644]MBD8694111.1 ABC transporter ATP-binding protein [Rhizobium sp. CFBP 13717]